MAFSVRQMMCVEFSVASWTYGARVNSLAKLLPGRIASRSVMRHRLMDGRFMDSGAEIGNKMKRKF